MKVRIALTLSLLIGLASNVFAVPPPAPFPPVDVPPITTPLVLSNGHFSANGQRALLWGVNFDASCIWGLLNPKNGVMQLDPAQQQVYTAEIARMYAAGVRCVRPLGFDASNIGPIYANGTTVSFDPAKVAAAKWFFGALKAQGIRVLIPLHYTTVNALADLGPNPSPLAQESVTLSWMGNPIGRTSPWDYLDKQTLWPKQMAFDTAIAQLVGNDPMCIGFELENENPLVKISPWPGPAMPAFTAAFTAYSTAWCQAHGIASFGSVEHGMCWAQIETDYANARAANLRLTCPNAIIIPNTVFGDGAFNTLQSSIAMGGAISGHFYSRYTTGSNGFLNGRDGQASPDARSRFAAFCAGIKWQRPDGTEIPALITEYGCQAQFRPNALDPFNELTTELMSATWTMVNADIEVCFLYSWATHAIWAGGLSSQSGPYDCRNMPQYIQSMRGCADVFCNPALRSSSATVLHSSYGIYGTMFKDPTTGKQTLQVTGPYTDPKVYNPVDASGNPLPFGTKTIFSN
jgi:hypothetical protein